jgi:parvulin-like peptidyl-prolyl isomerase
MLGYFRTRQSKILLYFITGLICIVMLSFGVVMQQYQPRETWILKVDGRKVPIKYFAASYQQATAYFQNMMQGQFNPQMLSMFPIHTMVVNNLKERELLATLTDKMNLVYSPAFVKDQILDQDVFRDDKQFSFKRYKNYLARGTVLSPITPQKYEAYLGQGFLVQTLDKAIRDSFQLTPDHQKIMNTLRQTEYKLKVYALNPNELKTTVSFTPDEVKAYADDPKNQTLLQNAYFKNIATYQQKDVFQANHILISLPAESDTAAQEAALEKSQGIYEKVMASPENFGALAKEHSQDPGSKSNDGDLGSFSSGDMVKPFEDQLRLLKPEEISKPFKTQFGYHIAKLVKFSPGKTIPLEDVKGDLAQDLLKDQKKKELIDTHQPLLEQYFKNRNHKDIERILTTNLTIDSKETEFFSVYQAEIPNLGKSYELRRHLKHHGSTYNAGDFISEFITINNIPHVVQFVEKRDFFTKATDATDPKTQFEDQMKQKWQDQIYAKYKEGLADWFDVIVNEKALASLKSRQQP